MRSVWDLVGDEDCRVNLICERNILQGAVGPMICTGFIQGLEFRRTCLNTIKPFFQHFIEIDHRSHMVMQLIQLART